ncbi:MAG: glycosyl hydrolase family 28-related protein [Pseudomonas sp.]
MTVSSQTNNVTFVGNGVATSFPLPFRFFSNGDIRAFKIDTATGASTALAIGVDYTLIGAGEPEVDGNAISILTLTSPLPLLLGLYVERVMSPVQETDIVNQGEFFAATHEDVFDRITMLIQQANANSSGAIRVAIGDPEPTRLLPAAQRANLLLGFDSSGQPITVAPTSGSAADLAMLLANNTNPTKGAALVGYKRRTVAARLSDVASVKDYGAVGNGVSDDTSAIQAAETAVAAAGGGILIFPPGNYLITRTINKQSSNVLWLGAGKGAEHDAGAGEDSASSITWGGMAGHLMVNFSSVSGGARRVSGGGITGIGFYGLGVAARALSINSVMSAEIDIYVEDFTASAVYSNVVPTLGEAKDTRDNIIKITGKQVSASAGPILTIDGDYSANTCCNYIYVRGLYKNSTAVIIRNSDNNKIYQWTFRFGGGTGLGADVHGGATAKLSARSNVWSFLYAGDGGITFRGTESYAVASYNNSCQDWDSDNAQPSPTIGTGSSFTWRTKDGSDFRTEIGIVRSAANRLDVYGGAGKILTRYNFITSADSLFTFSHGVGSISLAASSDTALDVSFGITTKGAGQGDLYSGNFSAKRFSWNSAGISFNGNAPISKPTITGSRGGNAALESLLTQLATYGLITDGTSA